MCELTRRLLQALGSVNAPLPLCAGVKVPDRAPPASRVCHKSALQVQWGRHCTALRATDPNRSTVGWELYDAQSQGQSTWGALRGYSPGSAASIRSGCPAKWSTDDPPTF